MNGQLISLKTDWLAEGLTDWTNNGNDWLTVDFNEREVG